MIIILDEEDGISMRPEKIFNLLPGDAEHREFSGIFGFGFRREVSTQVVPFFINWLIDRGRPGS